MTHAPASDGHEPAWVDAVLRFWFDECGPRQWFARDDAFDAALRERFGALHEHLAGGDWPLAADAPRHALAAILVLDQFSRNLHRGDAKAFANDRRARKLADDAIEQGFDAAMTPAQRLFLFLPFEHSESLADQERAVALVEALGNAEWTRFAAAHRDLIARFGRFPHRNAALGRASSAEEIEFLQQPGSGF
jgi:uncharacterized protein (DUF924 family)